MEALQEIGDINPWFDGDVDSWVFEHPLYPVEYAGDSKEDVIKHYPDYLREFIHHRLDERLHPIMEEQTKGHGGKRAGAGRRRGAKKESTKIVRVPKDVAEWLKQPESVPKLRAMMAKGKH